jgi:uncharacterized protein (TIGR03086 family)
MMPHEHSVFIPLDTDETFALITRPDRLRRWQAITARVDLRAGGEYRWTIIPGHTARGTFTEIEPGRRVVFTWGWEGSDNLPPGASTVIVTLEPAPGGTTIRLVHDGLTDEQADAHAMGWTHYLGRLADAAADGDAGPDEWAAPAELDPLTCAGQTLSVCQRVLRGMTEADRGRATACTEFTVAQLADHLTGSITAIGGGAGAAFPPATPAPLEARVADAAQVALEAWDGRGPDGTVTIGDSDLPAAVALGILSIELLVHGWDFAQATGQRVAVPDSVTAYVLDAASAIITPEGRRRVGFDPERPADPDAGVLERLIAFTGRPANAGQFRPA